MRCHLLVQYKWMTGLDCYHHEAILHSWVSSCQLSDHILQLWRVMSDQCLKMFASPRKRSSSSHSAWYLTLSWDSFSIQFQLPRWYRTCKCKHKQINCEKRYKIAKNGYQPTAARVAKLGVILPIGLLFKAADRQKTGSDAVATQILAFCMFQRLSVVKIWQPCDPAIINTISSQKKVISEIAQN